MRDYCIEQIQANKGFLDSLNIVEMLKEDAPEEWLEAAADKIREYFDHAPEEARELVVSLVFREARREVG